MRIIEFVRLSLRFQCDISLAPSVHWLILVQGDAAISRSTYADHEDDDDAKRQSKFVQWSVRRTAIMQKYTTTGSIAMPSFVSSEVAQAGRGGNTLKARVDAIEVCGIRLRSL